MNSTNYFVGRDRLRRQRHRHSNGITVNGIEWTGNIKTVGAGCMYTDYASAFSGQMKPTLYLGQNGYYNNQGSTLYHHSDLILVNMEIEDWCTPYQGGAVANPTCTYSSAILYERCYFYTSSTNWNTAMYLSNDTSRDRPVIFNRCYYDGGIGSQVYAVHGGDGNTVHPQAIFINCTFKRGYAHFANIGLNNIKLIRCAYNSSWYNYNCGGSFALADVAAEGTAGYGHPYGHSMTTGVPEYVQRRSMG